MHARKTVSVVLALSAGSPHAADNYLDALDKESAPLKAADSVAPSNNTLQAGEQKLSAGLNKTDFEAALRSSYPGIHRDYMALSPDRRHEVHATYLQFPSINAIRPRIADFAK